MTTSDVLTTESRRFNPVLHRIAQSKHNKGVTLEQLEAEHANPDEGGHRHHFSSTSVPSGR